MTQSDVPQSDYKSVSEFQPPKGSEWQVLQAYQQVINEAKEKQEKELIRNKKLKFKEALDQQIKAAKEIQSKQKQEERLFSDFVNEDVKQFWSQEQQKKEQNKEKFALELNLRKQQIDEHQKKLRQDKEALRRQEEIALEEARVKITQEQEVSRQKKMRELDMRAIIEKYNEENERRKAAQKIEDMKEDNRLMREYAERLDREEFERENAFKNRMAVLEKIATKYAEEGAGKIQREVQAKQELLLLREQQRKEAADLQKEKQKDEERRQRIRQAIDENEKQIFQQRQLDELNRVKDAEIARQYRADGDAHKRQVAEKKKEVKEKQLEYREVLYGQMRERASADTKLTAMVDREKKFNMDVLRRVGEDPEVLSKVAQKVGISAPTAAKPIGYGSVYV